MLRSYNQIWCMSDGNVRYIKEHYPQLSKVSINRLYNSAKIKPLPIIDRNLVRQKYGYAPEDVIAIFGGNMGLPQRLENILMLAAMAIQSLPLAKFLFIGEGTETVKLIKLADSLQLGNVRFIQQLPREDYENVTFMADIGLVSLDPRFTVPNFPSKTTDYFKLKLPILASLDSCAAKDYGYFLTDLAKAGKFALADDKITLFTCFKELYDNPALRVSLGENGRRFYEQELDVKKAFNTIIDSLKK